MKHILTASLPLMAIVVQGQTPNFSEHIAPIIYGNCTGCHRPGNIGPFPFETYDDVVTYAASIKYAVENDIMPPWPPDTSFQRYAHERILSQQEKTTLIDWVNGGTPRGDSTLAPPVPNFPPGSVLGTPDLKVRIPVYASQATSTDEYKCFYLPTNLTTARKVKAIEIIPGNREIVHHVLAYIGDASSAPADSACKTQGLKLMTGYTPGAGATVFPNGKTVKMGMTLSAGAVIVLQIHYPVGTAGQTDSTSVNLFFYPENETNMREVSADAILQNWTLAIAPNTVKSYTAQYPGGSNVLPADFSVLSVFPHMHLVGTFMDSYAVTGVGDTIPFARIPEWDFEWQGFYNFRKIVKLPAGSKMYANATYDNTSANPNNPNNPPQWVLAGEATTDEMFLVYFHYLPYQAGDELLDLDTLLDVTAGTNTERADRNHPNGTRIYPNPFTSAVHIVFASTEGGDIFDLRGRQVRTLETGRKHYVWDGTDDTGSSLTPGIYIVRSRDGAAAERITLMR